TFYMPFLDFRSRAVISAKAASTSRARATESTPRPGRSFTWRPRLPVPSSKRAGSFWRQPCPRDARSSPRMASRLSTIAPDIAGPKVITADAIALPACVTAKTSAYPTDKHVEMKSSASTYVLTFGFFPRSARKKRNEPPTTVTTSASNGFVVTLVLRARFHDAYEVSPLEPSPAIASDASTASTAASSPPDAALDVTVDAMLDA